MPQDPHSSLSASQNWNFDHSGLNISLSSGFTAAQQPSIRPRRHRYVHLSIYCVVWTGNNGRGCQGGICPPPPGGRWRGMSLSLNFQVWHQMAYFVLMRYGHSTSSPSLTLPINTILAHAVVNIRPLPRPIQRRSCGTASTVMKLYHYVFAILFYLWNAVEVNVLRGRPIWVDWKCRTWKWRTKIDQW